LLYGRRLAAAVGECGQCHVVSVRRKLNTKLTLAKKLTRQNVHFQGSLDPHVSTTKLHLDRFSRYCRIPLLPSHRARVVGHISCCSCHTMRCNNCMARIYARHKTGLKSAQVILYWNSYEDKSASILPSDQSIDTIRL